LYHPTTDEHYGELAYHFSRSGNTEKAIEYLQLAGQQAVRRSAYAEAVTHLTTALHLLSTRPDTRERAQQELMLHLTLGAPLHASRGSSSPEVKATYTRAKELCHQLGETRQLFQVLFGLRTFHYIGGELRAARALAEQLLSLAEQEHDPDLIIDAYRALGSALYHLGEFSAAQAHLEQSLTLYNTQRAYHGIDHVIEPGVLGLTNVAEVLWFLGYPDQALQKSKDACTLAQGLPYPYSLSAALLFTALVHQFRRESPLTKERAEAAITLAHEHGFPVFIGHGAVLQGWALAEQGQIEEEIRQIRQGIATDQAIEAGIWKTDHLVRLAEAYGKAGQVEEGLLALAETLAVMDKTGERFCEAELYRLKGELLLAKAKKLRH